MTSRTQLAAEIDRLDTEIVALQDDKKAIFAAYREEHGKAECKAAQAAIKRRQKYADGKREEIEDHDDLVDEIFTEIYSGTDDAIARSALRTKADAPSAKLGASVGGAEYSVSEASRPNAPGPLGAASVAREDIADRSIAHPVDPASSPGTEADADPASIEPESHEGTPVAAVGGVATPLGETVAIYSNLSGPPEPDGRAEGDHVPAEPTAQSSSANTSLADAKLISRVTATKRKGLPIGEAGDSARFTRLVMERALRLANGRLFVPAFAPEEEFA
jgi:hypothetical protein